MRIVVLYTLLILMVGYAYAENFIETADIEFTRCKSDDSMWCLTNNQYMVLMMQLSARKDCKE